MKEKLGQFREFIKKLSRKTKILIGTALVLVVLVIGAVVVARMLNRSKYDVLYSDVNTDEAQQIVGLLQDSEVDYRYDGQGTIYVPSEDVDQVKADLASQGYPKSGFTYDIFTTNATMLTTDSDKQTYKLYELQDRIGATISLFDNVKDAKVTIAMGEEQKYALDDSDQEEASASVVMIMEDDGSPTEEQAEAVQNLVSKAIPGMTITNVAVFDGNGIDVSVQDAGEDTGMSSEENNEITQLVEEQISKKVMNVLSPVYGSGNVRVSTKATLNMETLVRETIDYSTPEKIDQNDKSGLLSDESGSREWTSEDEAASGVAGTETNADVPEYNTDDTEDTEGYGTYTYDRDYLYNQVKEQGQVPSGAIDDLSVAVTINGEDLGALDDDDLKSLIGNAAGIGLVDQDEKITVLAAPFYDNLQETETQTTTSTSFFANRRNLVILGVILGVLLLLGIALALVLARRRKKKAVAEEAGQEEIASLLDALDEERAEGAQAALSAEREQEKQGEEVLSMESEKSMELRQQIRDFAEQSPEIAAQMLRSWLNGGEADGGRNSRG